MKPMILLFDIDGVLVQPDGYRMAFEATCKYFLERCGIDTHLPYSEIYAWFESQRVTSEWDMVPLTILMVLDAHSESKLIPDNLGGVDEIVDWVNTHKGVIHPVDFHQQIEQMGKHILPGITAAQNILNAKFSINSVGIFKQLTYQLVSILLKNTRDMYLCSTTKKFQEFALGEDLFRQVYDNAPDRKGDSFLLTQDQCLMENDIRNLLIERTKKKQVYAVVYTARPSMPPIEYEVDVFGYSPEAELALKLCKLEDLPMIGYGSLDALAQVTGRTIPEFIKPAPVQALSAMAAAWTGNEWQGLQWAARIGEGKLDWEGASLLPKEFELYILEDSAAGLQGGRSAVNILNSLGWKVNFHPIGISSHKDKILALEKTGAEIFPDVNRALERILING
jgi:hypothetical protein